MTYEESIVSLRKRLLNRVLVSKSGCWEWQGCFNKFGYGKIGQFKFQMGVHRASWIVHNGPIPNGLFVLHKCDNRKCANPDHLFLGTQADNMADCAAKGRIVGKPRSLNEEHLEYVKSQIKNNRSMRSIAIDLGVGRGVVERATKRLRSTLKRTSARTISTQYNLNDRHRNTTRQRTSDNQNRI